MVNGPLYYQEFIKLLLTSLPHVINYAYSDSYRQNIDSYLGVHSNRSNNIITNDLLFSNIFIPTYLEDQLINYIMHFYIVVKNKANDTISKKLITYLKESNDLLIRPDKRTYLQKIKKISSNVLDFYTSGIIYHSSKSDYKKYKKAFEDIQFELRLLFSLAKI
jgi:hypothetical protein